LLALAHRFDDLLQTGEVASMAELARIGQVTRARLSQIMDLTLLAPDIQEAVLAFPPNSSGRDPLVMRDLLRIVRVPYWPEQRRLCHEVRRILQPGT
jgi:hypothetical protein